MKRSSAPAVLFINVIAIEENSAPTPLNRMVPSAQEAADPSAATTPMMWSFKLSRGRSHSSVGPEKISPTRPDESSAVRSAGLFFRKSDPSRSGRSMSTCAGGAACERTRAKRFYRPWRDGHLFCITSQHFVLGYFHWSLRDDFSSHTSKPH